MAIKEWLQLEEAEWHKYLTSVELDELKSIHESLSLVDNYDTDKKESFSKVFRINKNEFEAKVKPYIRLAIDRRDKPDIRRYKHLSIRILSRLWDMVYGVTILLVLGILTTVVVKIAI
jgi:hypothetical protein